MNFTTEQAMDQVASGGRHAAGGPVKGERLGDQLAAELDIWNRAFAELELPWHWDVQTYRDLVRIAGERECVGAYVEREKPHLLRVYEKSFLRDLVQNARDRCRTEAFA